MRRASWVLVVVVVACSSKREDKREPPPRTPPVTTKPAEPAPGCEQPGGTVCVDDEVVECQQNGMLGVTLQRCNGGCSAGTCRETCAVRDAELVYVVDSSNTLSSFDPRKLPSDPFHAIGKLACEPSGPFSMAVDRMGIAWVLYRSGKVYRVSIIDAKCTQGLPVEGAPGLFGMGFVTDGPNATTEKLFVAGFDDPHLAELELSQKHPAWRTIGELQPTTKMNPELSGTGGGKLFGFFPEDGVGAFVQEIDRATARLVGKRMKVGSPRGEIGAWAFAHWGGDFYVFVTIDGNSRVYAIDGKTGRSQLVRENVAASIVGAGVSTCAPLLEQPAQ